MSFKKSNYQERFENLELTDETFSEIEFEDCEFIDCRFMGTKFNKCKFINCKFDKSVISAMVVINSRFVDVAFENSKVIGIDWTKAAHVESLSFQKCQLNYSNFRLMKLQKIKIIDCEAKEIEFIEADLSEADLSGTDFEKSIFSKTILTKANFQGAKNYFINIKNNVIKDAQFSLPEALNLLDTLEIKIVK